MTPPAFPATVGLVLAVLLVPACNKLSADECKREAAALQALLREADTGPSLFFVDDAMQLVQRTDLPDAELLYAPIIIIGERELRYRGQLIASADELRERLVAAHAKIVEDIELGRFSRASKPDPARVYFQIDARAKWSRVVEVWRAAQDAELRAPGFVFAIPQTLKPPPRAPIDTQLDALVADKHTTDKATNLAKLISEEVKRCPALVSSFGSVANEAPESKSERLIRALGPALVDCKCDVNIPNLRAVMYRLLANPHPARVLRLDPAAPAQAIALPATATWADAKLPADLANATFSVAE